MNTVLLLLGVLSFQFHLQGIIQTAQWEETTYPTLWAQVSCQLSWVYEKSRSLLRQRMFDSYFTPAKLNNSNDIY